MDAQSRLKAGIFFNARREQGGLYQYALTLVDSLRQYVPENDYILYHATLEDLPVAADAPNWQVKRLDENQVRLRMGIEGGLMTLSRCGYLHPLQLIPEYGEIRADRPDVMIYVKPTIHVFQWPYAAIFPIHDLQHRLQPEFREVASGGESARREYQYRNSIPRAKAILTDSETGREDVINLYHAEPGKVFPLPYICPAYIQIPITPDDILKIQSKYNLPDQYLFYPAAFWSHKNHKLLILALHHLKVERGVCIPLALAGGLRHEYPEIKKLVEELGLSEQVHFLGYVPDQDMKGLYSKALALVMPTFFGPTNIPVLEAWATGCPVITSDIRGIREQVGNAGILINPRDETELANAIWHLMNHEPLREEIITRGRQKIMEWTPRDFAERLRAIMNQSTNRRVDQGQGTAC